ncbi:MAG: ATP-binding protein [Alphaproteobacteria bacterium]|nr:ATP-binding protein [Alphaproteobacteria bacterium]
MFLERHLQKKVLHLANHAKVILVLGARQVGKSTLLKQMYPELPHITFDPFVDLYNVKEDPDLFLSQYNGPVILDEIQFHPELMSAIKRKVDGIDKPGQYFLTGSQSLSVLKNAAESMAGRVMILHMNPMTIHELYGHPDQHWLPPLFDNPKILQTKFLGVMPEFSLWQTLWRGGFPGFIRQSEDLHVPFFGSYVQTYIERDIRLVENIRELREFDRFIRILSTLSAQEIDMVKVGQEVGVSGQTIKRWVNLADATYLWQRLDPYHGNTLKRLVKKPKGIFADTGLACHLIRLSTPDAVGSYPHLGALFESFVVNQIKAILESSSIAASLYHWRTSNGAEVDLLIEHNNTFYPIEIKSKTLLNKHDARGLKAFKETYPNMNIGMSLIIYPGERCFYLDKETLVLPCHGLFDK